MVVLDPQIIDSIHYNATYIKQLKFEESSNDWRPVLEIEVSPSIEQDPTMINITSWKITSYSPKQMQI